MLQYVRTVCQRVNRLPRPSVRMRRPVALWIEVLEDRCTPASLYPQIALIATYQPGFPAMLTTNAPAADTASLVRTDLFGGAVEESSDTADDRLVAIEAAFAPQDSALDLKARHQTEEPAARPDEVSKDAEDWANSRKETHDAIEEYAACILLEYDAAVEGE